MCVIATPKTTTFQKAVPLNLGLGMSQNIHDGLLQRDVGKIFMINLPKKF